MEKKQLADYRPIVGDTGLAEISALADPLCGARVVHVNATAFGGGVAEMLQTLVPLMRDVGLDAEWQVIEGEDEFSTSREGFGLVVTEALWKGKLVVGGNAGGVPLQVIDGETGFLVDSVEECRIKALYLLQHPEEAAREHVRRNFLTTRHLADYLRLFAELAA